MSAKPVSLTARDLKILKLSQAHVAPGMNLVAWQQILTRRNVPLNVGNPWPTIPETVLDAIIEDIGAIVAAYKERTNEERTDEYRKLN